MARMTEADCADMFNLINTHTKKKRPSVHRVYSIGSRLKYRLGDVSSKAVPLFFFFLVLSFL